MTLSLGEVAEPGYARDCRSRPREFESLPHHQFHIRLGALIPSISKLVCNIIFEVVTKFIRNSSLLFPKTGNHDRIG